jgi:two-component system cell cycle response regulator
MGGQTFRVLLVEDTVSNVRMLEAKLLQQGGFSVDVAFDGFEALERLAVQTFDVVLLDVMMPGMDGFETCRRIKRDPRTQSLPVIMVTALDSPADRQLGFEAGADEFYVKPVEDGLLFPRMVELIGGADRRRILAAPNLAGLG